MAFFPKDKKIMKLARISRNIRLVLTFPYDRIQPGIPGEV